VQVPHFLKFIFCKNFDTLTRMFTSFHYEPRKLEATESRLEAIMKAALAVLQHQHGWVAKQQLSIDVEQRISITAALETAQQRVVEALENNPSETVEFKEVPRKQKVA
jgi:hypothetical protein